MSERESSSRHELLKTKAQELGRDWKAIAYPQGEPPWFLNGDRLPAFDPSLDRYSTANAWWLLELCRLVYTPDHKEATRAWSRFDREPHLEHTPFREVHSVHKTGTHAAIYRFEGSGADGEATILCFRGTTKFRQWVMNLSTLPVSWSGDGDEDNDGEPVDKHERPYVHHGFKILFDRIWPKLEPLLHDQPGPLFIAGHSLGGALALMSAALHPPKALYTFGSPRVGNPAFCDQLGDLVHHRVVNHHDIVTLLPHAVENFAPYDFRHHGELVHLRDDELDWRPTRPLTFLTQNVKSAHPPEGIVDHTPTAYERALVDQLENGAL